MAKSKYIEDYEIEISLDDKGRENKTLKYRGPYYDVSFTNLDYKKYKRFSIILFAGILFFHVLCGFSTTLGMYQIYVALPYAVVYLPLIFSGFSIFGLPKNHLKIQRDELERTFKRIKINSIFLIVLLAIAILGEIIFIFANASIFQLTSEIVFLITEFVSILIVIGLSGLQKIIHIQISSEKSVSI